MWSPTMRATPHRLSTVSVCRLQVSAQEGKETRQKKACEDTQALLTPQAATHTRLQHGFVLGIGFGNGTVATEDDYLEANRKPSATSEQWLADLASSSQPTEESDLPVVETVDKSSDDGEETLPSTSPSTAVLLGLALSVLSTFLMQA